MRVVVKTAPGQLPLALSTAMRHIRGLEDDVDLMELYTRAAVESVEDYTGRALFNTVYTAQIDSWPTFPQWWGIEGPADRAKQALLYVGLPRSPLVSVTSVNYYPDGGGAQALLAGANYRVDTRSLPGRLVFVDGVALPALAVRADAVEIEFTAGQGTKESDVSPALLTCVLQLARHFFDNPGSIDPTGKVKVLPYSFDMLCRQFRI